MQPAENANGKLTSDLGDLLTLDDDLAPATASQPAATSPNYLQDLLGGGLSTPSPAAASSAAAPDLLDLLGGATSAPAPAQVPHPTPLERICVFRLTCLS